MKTQQLAMTLTNCVPHLVEATGIMAPMLALALPKVPVLRPHHQLGEPSLIFFHPTPQFPFSTIYSPPPLDPITTFTYCVLHLAEDTATMDPTQRPKVAIGLTKGMPSPC